MTRVLGAIFSDIIFINIQLCRLLRLLFIQISVSLMSPDNINFCLDEIFELLFLQEVLIGGFVCINKYLAVCVT